jgi:protein-disulfide isomerase
MPTTPPTQTADRRTRLLQARKRSHESLLIAALPLMFLLGLGSGWLIWGSGFAQQAANPTEQKRYTVTDGGNPAIGPDDAPVTIIEFSDYQCPYCKLWYDQVYQRLMKEYAGRIRFVYRDFPLEGIHPDAGPAAQAANCAGEQGHYYSFHDALFSDQYGLGEKAYQQYAADLGLDLTAFNTCLSEKRFASEVQADLQAGYDNDVTSTPTFFINGIIIVGAQPYSAFQQIIDQELAGGQ